MVIYQRSRLWAWNIGPEGLGDRDSAPELKGVNHDMEQECVPEKMTIFRF